MDRVVDDPENDADDPENPVCRVVDDPEDPEDDPEDPVDVAMEEAREIRDLKPPAMTTVLPMTAHPG